MAGVEAHADARRAVEVIDDRGEMLEAIARATRPCPAVCSSSTIVLRRGRALKPTRSAVGDQAQPVLFGACGAGARMNDDAEQAERVRAIELVDEGRDRLIAKQRGAVVARLMR